MTWHIYASDGRRAEWCSDPAWGKLGIENKVRDYLGFENQHQLWRPRWFAARMARGWRLFTLDVDPHDFYHRQVVTTWWRSAAPDQRRFPNIAALEMWVRHVGASHGR